MRKTSRTKKLLGTRGDLAEHLTPGQFVLVFDIVRAERAVEDAREALRSIRLVAGD